MTSAAPFDRLGVVVDVVVDVVVVVGKFIGLALRIAHFTGWKSSGT